MKIKRVLFTGVLAVVLLGCGKQPEPRHIVILPDVSGSIDRQSLEQAFKGIDDLVGNLHRGDKITIIPIFGDAQVEASGRIIRYEVSRNRQAYDSDLGAFKAKLKYALEHIKTEAIQQPGLRTDILGSISLVEQEFHADTDEAKRVLIILSDFIQEDGNLDFRFDGRLANQIGAKRLAAKLIKAQSFDFRQTQVYLGLLRSSEYMNMSKSRRDALEAFWREYFNSRGAHSTFASDGAGLVGPMMSAF